MTTIECTEKGDLSESDSNSGWIIGVIKEREDTNLRMKGKAILNYDGNVTIIGTELLSYTPPLSNLLNITINTRLQNTELPIRISMTSFPAEGKATAVYTETKVKNGDNTLKMFRSIDEGDITVTQLDEAGVSGYFSIVLKEGESAGVSTRSIRGKFNTPVKTATNQRN